MLFLYFAGMSNTYSRLIPPWNALFLTAGLFGLSSVFVEGSVDLHFHDTYFVLSRKHIFEAVFVFLVFLGVIYFYGRAWLRYKILSWLHIAITVATLSLCVIPAGYETIAETPRRYYECSPWNQTVAVVVLIAVAGQLIFGVNLIIGILFKITRRT